MVNEQLVEAVLNKYGLEKTVIFCEIQTYVNRILMADFNLNHPEEVNEFSFEKDWYAEKAYNLNQELKKQKDEQKILDTRTRNY